MPKEEIAFEEFLSNVNPTVAGYVQEMHDFLTANGCVLKIAPAASGYVVSYNVKKTKKVIINFVFRKAGLIIRIYGDNVNQYAGLLETMPDGMVKAVEKAPDCKRLLDPDKCNPRCAKGYVFDINGTTHQKCRYSCFMFEVKDENYAAIRAMLEREINARLASA